MNNMPATTIESGLTEKDLEMRYKMICEQEKNIESLLKNITREEDALAKEIQKTEKAIQILFGKVDNNSVEGKKIKPEGQKVTDMELEQRVQLNRKIKELQECLERLNDTYAENITWIYAYDNIENLRIMLVEARKLLDDPEHYADSFETTIDGVQEERKKLRARAKTSPIVKVFKGERVRTPKYKTVVLENVINSIKHLQEEHKGRRDFMKVFGPILELSARAQETMKSLPFDDGAFNAMVEDIFKRTKTIIKTYELGEFSSTGRCYPLSTPSKEMILMSQIDEAKEKAQNIVRKQQRIANNRQILERGQEEFEKIKVQLRGSADK